MYIKILLILFLITINPAHALVECITPVASSSAVTHTVQSDVVGTYGSEWYVSIAENVRHYYGTSRCSFEPLGVGSMTGKDGIYCLCRLLSPFSSQWISAQPATTSSYSDCIQNCPLYCAQTCARDDGVRAFFDARINPGHTGTWGVIRVE